MALIDCLLVDRLLTRRLAEDKLGASREAVWCARTGVSVETVTTIRETARASSADPSHAALIAFQLGMERGDQEGRALMFATDFVRDGGLDWCRRYGIANEVLDRIAGIYGTFTDPGVAAASAWKLAIETWREAGEPAPSAPPV